MPTRLGKHLFHRLCPSPPLKARAAYGLLRCILLLDRAEYDDPTELATHDRPFQAAGALFGVITLAVMLLLHPGSQPVHAG
jgi:hypothetical protein